MDKERSTVCSHENADDVVENVPSVLKKNVIGQELQHTDDFTLCVAPFVCFSCSTKEVNLLPMTINL